MTFVNTDTIYESKTTTAADSSHDFTGLPAPGRYKVRFSAGGRSQYAHQKPDSMSADAVTLAPGQTAVVDDQILWVPAPQN